MALTITGGMALGAGIWAGIRVALRAARALVRRTKTKRDDQALDKMEAAVRYLENHPELVDVLHGLMK